MSLAESLKDKKIIIIIAAAAMMVVTVILIAMPSGNKKYTAETEVVSTRVKIEQADIHSEGAAPRKDETKEAPAANIERKEVQNAPPAITTAKNESEAPRASIKVDLAEDRAQKEPVREQPAARAEKPEKRETEKREKGALQPVKKAASRPEEKAEVKTTSGRPQKDAPSKTASLRPWAVNVASFSSLNDAQDLASSLKTSGYKAYITEYTKNKTIWHRVRVGFFQTREEAGQAAKKIGSKYKFESSWVVRPARAETLKYSR